MSTFDQFEVWFVTGAQLLYGGDAVIAVDAHSNEMVAGLNNSGNPSVTAQSYLQNYLERENGLAGTSSFNAPHNSENITGETSYYSSYSDSYSSENAILIEPPVKPPVQSNSCFNPRNQKFKPRQNPFPFSKPNYNLFTQKQISDLLSRYSDIYERRQ